MPDPTTDPAHDLAVLARHGHPTDALDALADAGVLSEETELGPCPWACGRRFGATRCGEPCDAIGSHARHVCFDGHDEEAAEDEQPKTRRRLVTEWEDVP